MRGAIILLASATDEQPGLKSWKCVVLDWFSRKHAHVVRSTFAAELHSMLDAAGLAILLNATWTEIFSPPLRPAELAQRQDKGDLLLPMDMLIDARAVRDGIAANPIKVPADKTLYIHVLAGRDLIDRGLFERLIWIDTNDMVTDGMTKGSIDRTALTVISRDGTWRLTGDSPVVFASNQQKYCKRSDLARANEQARRAGSKTIAHAHLVDEHNLAVVSDTRTTTARSSYEDRVESQPESKNIYI